MEYCVVKDWKDNLADDQVADLRRLAKLRKLEQEDKVVAKRGEPSLPKLRFMEGLGPEDPKFAA